PFERIDRVIAAHADALARMKLRAALAHDDVARHDDLAAKFLDAQPPARAIAAIARRAACFLMSHSMPPSPRRALPSELSVAHVSARDRATRPRRESR